MPSSFVPNNTCTCTGTTDGTDGTDGTTTPPTTPPTVVLPSGDLTFLDLSDDPTDPDNENLSVGDLSGFSGGLRALAGDDTVTGSTSDEAINGNQGQDVLFGDSGEDTLRGGQDQDRVFGEGGDDILNGNRGLDLVLGGIGNDLVRGGQDSDLLVGEKGNDTLIGDFGQDLLVGGTGDDLFLLRTDTGVSNNTLSDVILDFDATDDRIGLTGGLQENDLVFQSFSVALPELLASVGLFTGENFQDIIGLTEEILDPDNNGVVTGTLIQIDPDQDIIGRGDYLGFVVNATTTQVSNRIEQNIPDTLLGLG
ncbi:MAG TPA: calcium-binding protein [Oscillatoriaceae cyanobacterium M33_DOE_052]|uniref:Calcium-binding protein n=1 Tax=Planktothricoides sp. SpSt-374 TaxID=2282167 RepID=A0A7C3ZME1_9CYAN|nr:calcium-binding protein [Oscillatoriaceae cyanobacterium M33_DOE_052]